MASYLNFDSITIASGYSVIHFDAYKSIRKIAIDFEECFQATRKNKVTVLPLPDEGGKDIPRFVSASEGYLCEFYQDRVACSYLQPQEPKNLWKETLQDFQGLISKTYAELYKLTKAKITKAGMIIDFHIPTIESGKAIEFILTNFLKFSDSHPVLTDLDFHYAEKQAKTYNINVFVKPLRVGESEKDSIISIKLDINNYEGFKNNPNKRYGVDLFSIIGKKIADYFEKDIAQLLKTGKFSKR